MIALPQDNGKMSHAGLHLAQYRLERWADWGLSCMGSSAPLLCLPVSV